MNPRPRLTAISEICDLLPDPRDLGRPARVAVDGVDGAGKTTLANEVGAELSDRGWSVIRASVDAFHNPRAVRYRQGPDSPRGFWEDSFDYERLLAELVLPLGHGGNRRYRRGVHDVDTDESVDLPQLVATDHDLLLIDGIFLHRQETREFWDASVFVDVTFENSVARMAIRDGTLADPNDRSNRRYVEGQKIYLTEVDPRSRATIVVDNNNLEWPTIEYHDDSG